MDYDDVKVPVYLVTGFLDAGKTSFLRFTISQPYFQVEERTLLIVCEEGEEEYDEQMLKYMYRTDVVTVSEQEDFKLSTLRRFRQQYAPSRVIIEYNPLWSVAKLEQMHLPRGWGIMQEIVVVDASTFSVYMNNMKSLFVEMSRNADMVLFNRCSKELPLSSFRRSIKVVNPGCDVQFMGEDGRPLDIFEDTVPYDLKADPIEIEDIDYGIFYVDLQDHPDRYIGRTVRFRGKVLKSRDMNAEYFLPARSAMTCCAEDIQYIGYLCKSPAAKSLKEGSWVEVTATMNMEFVQMSGRSEPVFTAISVEPAKAPETELVYFN